jgi:hypothetical protein
MHRTLRTIALFISGGVLLSFTVVVVNQTAQAVELARTVHPAFGTIALWGLLGSYAVLIGTPAVMWFRLPAPLVPPASEDAPEFAEHLKKLGERLRSSPHLAGQDLSSREAIETALEGLAARADAIVREAAGSVFVATAVSQSGRLDAMLVLGAQTRMIWRIAHLYRQRPTLRELTHLYGNVAGTAFLAGELDDLDLGTQVEPVLSAAVGALGAAVPGFQVAASILTNCVLDGSANAFLTLRVGMIAKRSCGALVLEPNAALRRAATAEAAQHLSVIVADGTAKLSKALWRATRDKVGGAVSGFSSMAKDAGARAFAKVMGVKTSQAEV